MRRVERQQQDEERAEGLLHCVSGIGQHVLKHCGKLILLARRSTILILAVDDENHNWMWLACGFQGLTGRLLLVVAGMDKASSPTAEEIVNGVASLFALFLGRF